MKSFIRILALVIILNAGALISPQKVFAQETSVNFQLFYDQLSPDGMWVDYQNYGYVWIPNVDREFSPYSTDGHWILTDEGWTWVSDYSWGWAPFHYGRWDYDNSYGWLWIPGDEWGPAWVSWRRSSGYYGWAPMGPGVSVELSLGGGYRVPNERWTFVSDRDINRSDIDHHYIERSQNVTIINSSTIINNTYVDNSRHSKYVAGPAREDVQKVTGTMIKPVSIRENNKPGQTVSNDQLQIYRPRVQANNNDHKPVPTKLVTLKEVKPISERTAGNQPRNENLKTNGKEQASPVPSNTSAGKTMTGEQPRIVNPVDKNKSIEHSPQPQIVKPTDDLGTNRQPLAVHPNNKKMTIQKPQNPIAKLSDNQGKKQQQPRTIDPQIKNKIAHQQSKPKIAHQLNGRGPAPKKSPPPQNTHKDQGSPSQKIE